MKEYPLLLAGKKIMTSRKITVTNPYNGEPVGRASLADDKIIEQAIDAAGRALPNLKKMAAYELSEVLAEIARAIAETSGEFARIISLESAKPLRFSRGEVARAVQTFRVASEEVRRPPGEVLRIDWTPAGKGKSGMVQYFPVGPVAGISPFNFPLNLAVHKIAPALAARCPIILKPSSSTPLSTLKLAELFESVPLPEGAISILPAPRELGWKLVTDPRIRLISFTGSPAVGWKIKSAAGRKKVLLELGGNAGVIVTESADINDAVGKCITGAFAYSGQVCIHAQRFFVQESVFEAFKQKFIAQASQLKTGDPIDETTDISAMIDLENALRVEDWVNEAVAGGAEILLGGKRDSSYFPPTVLTRTRPQMKVCSMEIFGPVVTLEPYSKIEEAIDAVNFGRYGLQAGVFTNRLDEVKLVFEEIETGGIIINDVPTFRVDHMPYGGIKDSGLGREGVKYAMTEMMEPKILIY
ncbi:MAG: aldehyde dehydrogenase family protein [Bacteroidales bacterium]